MAMMVGTWNPVRRISDWCARRKQDERRRKCARGEHDWCCANEADSMVSLMCEIEGMPLVCPGCNAKATAHWQPGDGLSRISITQRPIL